MNEINKFFTEQSRELDDKLREDYEERMRKMYKALAAKCAPKPTDEDFKELFASLMWTAGLQDDLEKFLTKFPHLRPPKS